MAPTLSLIPKDIADDYDLVATEKRIALVHALQRTVVPQIIAAGVFNEDPWTDALAILAGSDPVERAADQALEAFFAEHDVQIPHPLQDRPDHEDRASNVVTSRVSHWGDTGFLLGLAVGMLLGPHAFGQNGGAR